MLDGNVIEGHAPYEESVAAQTALPQRVAGTDMLYSAGDDRTTEGRRYSSAPARRRRPTAA